MGMPAAYRAKQCSDISQPPVCAQGGMVAPSDVIQFVLIRKYTHIYLRQGNYYIGLIMHLENLCWHLFNKCLVTYITGLCSSRRMKVGNCILQSGWSFTWLQSRQHFSHSFQTVLTFHNYLLSPSEAGFLLRHKC